MARIRYIHWKAEEAEERADRLRALGHQVDADVLASGADLKAIREDPPAAVVIDLARLPSHGREVALALRTSKATRSVPLVFLDGDPAKVARLCELLPDATYSGWDRVARDLPAAVAHPPADPVVPSSTLAGYSGTPLPRKLGVKPGTAVALLDAPEDFEQTLGALPDGATLRRSLRGRTDLVLAFVRSRADLARALRRVERTALETPVWFAWPKKASGVATDLTGNVVRAAGLAAGLVDYKICAIDATWSGLLFTYRG